MNKEHASQIAELINNRNQLARRYSVDKIIEHSGNYIYELHEDVIIACVEIKRKQWYQWELRHLSVHDDHEGKGYGTQMIKQAETKAIDGGAKIIQCTIRVGNHRSECLFLKCGYNKTVTFYYPITGNDVAVWQKVVSKRS